MMMHTPLSKPFPEFARYKPGVKALGPCRSSKGFTLIEMLVVISIIAIMLTVGSLGLKNLTKGAGVTAGVTTAEAVFSEARATAQGRGTNTRVLIHAESDATDPLHRERYLRYMTIVVQQVDADGDPVPNAWELLSRGNSLPEGVYFMKDLSETDAPVLQKMSIELPGKSLSECFYYEFNSEGMITSPTISGDDIPRFVVRTGSLPPGAEDPIISSGAEKNVGGFVIWRSGRTSLFRHPKQITGTGN